MKHKPNEDNNPFRSLADLILNNESISVLATAIEENEIYFWDRFGRFKKTEKNDKNLALELLANHYDWESKQDPFSGQNPLEVNYYHPLNLYGWANDVIPNFEEIAKNLKEIKPPYRKSAETNQINTLLKIIAALLKKLKIDIDDRGVAIKIEQITQENDLPLTDDTIQKVILKIKDQFYK
jgi:hypothetical protein